MKTLLSIDPGASTGVVLLEYTEETAPSLVKAWQFTGGAKGLKDWFDDHWRDGGWDYYNDEPGVAGIYSHRVGATGPINFEWSEEANPDHDPHDENSPFVVEVPPNLTVIAEKFNARNTGGFSYTTASLEPLVCEGVMISYQLPSEWVSPPQQYIAGGKSKADKKKRQHRLLKDLGFYKTGKDFGTPDADDFRSATAHALGWLMRHGHKPTYEMVSKWVEENPA